MLQPHGHWVLVASDKRLLNTESSVLQNGGDLGLSKLEKESNVVTETREVCKLPRLDLEKVF